MSYTSRICGSSFECDHKDIVCIFTVQVYVTSPYIFVSATEGNKHTSLIMVEFDGSEVSLGQGLDLIDGVAVHFVTYFVPEYLTVWGPSKTENDVCGLTAEIEDGKRCVK